MSEPKVWVETVHVEGNGPTSPIGSHRPLAEMIRNRQEDINNAVGSISGLIRSSLQRLQSDDEWKLDQFEANVGVSLTAEAGAVITKASSTGTIGIKLTYKRTPPKD
ncbi:CU044_2847 family protein [Paenarthrobacter ilicis]|uniref:CU044_2847 family protein n=1 Tax=Paenarthrobacter ilicis TaxID=43665 RepID=UPI0038706AAF